MSNRKSDWKKKNIGLLFMVLVLTTNCIYGQVETRDYNEEVTIRGSYDPTINQAFKINTKPRPYALQIENPTFQYESITVDQPTSVSLAPIKAANIRTTKKTQSYKNYLKTGIGSWISPYLDFTHNSNNRESSFDAGLYHRSSFRNISGYADSPFSNTQLNIGWKKILDNHVFEIGAAYALDTYRYYGFETDRFPNYSSDLKQVFNQVNISLGLKSQYRKKEKLHHSFNLSGYYYFDRYNSTESNGDFTFDLHKSFSVTQVLNFQHLGIEGRMSYFGNQDSIRSNSEILVEGTPYFKAKYGIVNFLIGLRFAYLAADESAFAFNPVLKVDLQVVPETVSIYAAIDGGLEKNSFLKVTRLNPWFTGFYQVGQTDSTFKWQNNQFQVSGGIRGNIANRFGFNFQARYLMFKDMAFFVNTSGINIWGAGLPQNKFYINYDNGNLFAFSGELSYQTDADIKIWLNGEYNLYSLDSLAQPYHKPISRFGLGGSWLIKKKVTIWLETFYMGQRFAVDNETLFAPREITLDGFIDLNIGVGYQLTEDFNIWLNATNLLNNNYQRYLNYPVQGFEIMAGIGYRF